MRDHGRAVRTRVGRTIRRLRQQRALTQERLAELAGNGWKHIGQVERGEVNVGLDVLAQIADALSVGLGDLFADVPARRRSRPDTVVFTGDEVRRIEDTVKIAKERTRR